MTIHRNPAHSPDADPTQRARNVDAPADPAAPEPAPVDSQSRVRDRIAVDSAAEWPPQEATQPPGGPEPAPHPAAEPPAERQGERPGAGQAPERPTATEPEELDDLAEWVGSLAGAATDSEAIAEWGSPRASRPPNRDRRAARLDPVGEYRPSEPEPWQPGPAVSRTELIERLDALAAVVEIAQEGFPPELIERATNLLAHASARLRLSTDHTVVALAGGTGSGKSSLFNALCGLEFSRVGVTRPTTSTTHACVWGAEGSEPLLDWLGVSPRYRHSRVSELDRGDDELNGLILLDLPDHDSVRSAHASEVDRLVGSVDLMVWVLDPQKYADAAVHQRYLTEMTGHGAVMVAVLNQIDRLTPREIDDCLTDLRRLLESGTGPETVPPPRLLTASTVTGEGVSELREMLVETVWQRRASIDRLVADLEGTTEDFTRYGEATGSDRPGWERVDEGVPERVHDALLARTVEASGLSGISGATESAYERRGAAHVAWPVGRWIRRLRRDPLRQMQLEFLNDGYGGGIDGSVGVQRAEVDAAVDEAARSASEGLPDPWPGRVRSAARSNIADLPERIGAAVTAAVPHTRQVPGWWRGVRVGQYVLASVAGVSMLWLVALLGGSVSGATAGVSLLDDPAFLVLAGAVLVSVLLVGWLIEVGCRNLIVVSATRQREYVEEEGRARVKAVVAEGIVAPMEGELARYRQFTVKLAAARGEARSR